MMSLRPHHILCAIGFEGEGYDDAHAANMSHVVSNRLRAPRGASERVIITGHADTICAPCPKRRGMGCEDQARIDRTDAAHAGALGVAAGQIYGWGDLVDRVTERIRPEDLDRICLGCRWLEAGFCKDALRALLAQRADEASTGR